MIKNVNVNIKNNAICIGDKMIFPTNIGWSVSNPDNGYYKEYIHLEEAIKSVMQIQNK